jgi:hypothetical protein
MNSDFMQAESELLAKRAQAEPDNAAKIKKLYEFAYGRDPSEQEVKLGLDYLKAEPMQEYQEQKKLAEEKKAAAAAKSKTKHKGADAKAAGDAATNATPEGDPPMAAGANGDANAGMGEGMMAGVMDAVGRGRRGAAAAAEVKYKTTPLGRYAKVLLSSSEFVYID